MISIEFDQAQSVYSPGDAMTFRWRISRVLPQELQRLESSVLWYTEGKGDEDFAVHAFWEMATAELRALQLEEEQPVSLKLPYSPLSYEGRLLRIRWCVRLRLFLASGEEILCQQPFYLGPLTKEV